MSDPDQMVKNPEAPASEELAAEVEELTKEAEQKMLAAMDALTKEASDEAPSEDDFLVDEPSRLEDKPESPKKSETSEDETEDEEPAQQTGPEGVWGARPTVKNQMREHPDTVRAVKPRTVVLNPGDAAQLKVLNELEEKASDPEAPTVVILTEDRKFFEGQWSVYLKYAKLEYLQI